MSIDTETVKVSGEQLNVLLSSKLIKTSLEPAKQNSSSSTKCNVVFLPPRREFLRDYTTDDTEEAQRFFSSEDFRTLADKISKKLK